MKYITLTNSTHRALIDDEDYAQLAHKTWRMNRSGYAERSICLADGREKRGAIMLHREIMSPPADMEVDHINGDRLDNRRANLRIVTKQQNRQNIGKQSHREMTSRYKGVVQHPKTLRWRAIVKTGGKQRHLGYFATEHEAALAYNTAARELFGEFARLNEVQL